MLIFGFGLGLVCGYKYAKAFGMPKPPLQQLKRVCITEQYKTRVNLFLQNDKIKAIECPFAFKGECQLSGKKCVFFKYFN